MKVIPITFMGNGDRCLWDERGNASVMRADYSANDNAPFLARDTLTQETITAPGHPAWCGLGGYFPEVSVLDSDGCIVAQFVGPFANLNATRFIIAYEGQS